MIDVTLLGYVAACCTTCAFIPQVLHIVKTRDTRSISLQMYAIFVLGVSLWLGYGVIVNDKPLLIANAITLMFSSVILAMKIKDTLRDADI